MRILYDISSALPQKNMIVNGGGEYSFIVLKALLSASKKQAEEEIQINLLLNGTSGENKQVSELIEQYQLTLYTFMELSEIEQLVESEHFDRIVFPVCYAAYHNLRFAPDTSIISGIHDLSDVHLPKLSWVKERFIFEDGLDFIRRLQFRITDFSNSKKQIRYHQEVIQLSKNQTVYTVSNYSRQSFFDLLGIDRLGINPLVFYSPLKPCKLPDRSLLENTLTNWQLTEHKYFLFSSASRYPKNNGIAIFTLDKLFNHPDYSQLLADFKGVILGLDERTTHYYQKHLQHPERFILSGYVDQETLDCLYKGAHLFVYPSLLEGFGYPPVEAMGHGCVSACSDAMSIPEVCGDAVFYFNGYDKSSIKKALLDSMDKELYQEKQKSGELRYQEILHRCHRDLEQLINLILQSK